MQVHIRARISIEVRAPMDVGNGSKPRRRRRECRRRRAYTRHAPGRSEEECAAPLPCAFKGSMQDASEEEAASTKAMGVAQPDVGARSGAAAVPPVQKQRIVWGRESAQTWVGYVPS